MEKELRYRVNVSQTSTGKKSWEATVDGSNFTLEEIMQKSDDLVECLERRYPPIEGGK